MRPLASSAAPPPVLRVLPLAKSKAWREATAPLVRRRFQSWMRREAESLRLASSLALATLPASVH
eukprot:1226263-Alexandrium_andersonii.AAC.1